MIPDPFNKVLNQAYYDYSNSEVKSSIKNRNNKYLCPICPVKYIAYCSIQLHKATHQHSEYLAKYRAEISGNPIPDLFKCIKCLQFKQRKYFTYYDKKKIRRYRSCNDCIQLKRKKLDN